MLFDLTGKRKRFLQIVFALLAGVFAISFVGFGIGSDAGGGLFDAVGIGGGGGAHGGGGGNSPRNPQFEQQIQDAEAQLASNPTDEQALLDIARARFLAGQDESSTDEQGNINIPELKMRLFAARWCARSSQWQAVRSLHLPRQPGQHVRGHQGPLEQHQVEAGPQAAGGGPYVLRRMLHLGLSPQRRQTGWRGLARL